MFIVAGINFGKDGILTSDVVAFHNLPDLHGVVLLLH